MDSNKYILLNDVIEKCPSLSEKWSKFTEKWNSTSNISNTLFDWIILRACQGKLKLYCFKAIPPKSEKQFFPLVRLVGMLKLRQHRSATARCIPYFDNPEDQINDEHNPEDQLKDELNPEDQLKDELKLMIHSKIEVEVSRDDLYLDLEELAKLEKTDPDLSRTEASCETDTSDPKKPDSAKQSDIWNEQIAEKHTSIIHRASLAEKLQSKNNSQSAFPSSPDFGTVVTLDNQLLLPENINKESDLSTKAEKRNRIKQKNKKKEKLDIYIVDEVGDPIPLCKNEKELPPSKSQFAPEERYLRLDEVIGDKEKGIKGIISMSKSKWYAGISKGIFPEQFKINRNSYWKISEIITLQKRMENGELDPNRTT